MATLENNIQQAISDFDDIEAAIEEQGVEVPSGTDTSEYGNLIRNIPRGGGTVDQAYIPTSTNAQSGIAVAEALAGLPIKYVEGSSNADETTYLRDLESGTYVLKGTFKPYKGSGTVCKFSSNLLVNVVKGTLNKVPTSHIQIFYPVHNVVQFCDITDESYKRTDIKLNELANATTVEEMIAAANTAAQNLYGNALKATASGEVIRVDDVSPIEHTAKAKVSGKNLLNADGLINAAFSKNADGSFTFTKNGSARFTNFVDISIPTNTIISVSATKIEGTADGFAFQSLNQDGTYTSIVSLSPAKTYASAKVTNKPATIRLYLGSDEVDGAYLNISGLQIEIGNTATEYEPYIDPSTVTVTRCGKNLLEIKAKSTTSAGITYTVNEDGSVTANGTATDTSTLILDTAFVFKPNISYTLTGCPSGGGASTYRLDDTNKNADDGNGGTVTYSTETTNPIRIRVASGATVSNLKFYPMLVCKGESGDFEKCVISTHTPSADGTVEIVSLSPTMTLLTDTEGAKIDLVYNQDANKAMENVNADIQELDRVTAELTANMGDVETALDSIISLQEALIGGDSV